MSTDIKIKKLLIENYYKFLETHPKYFKSPLLLMNRYGFMQVGVYEKEIYKENKVEKTEDIIKMVIKSRKIHKGHIVWRIVKNGWGLPWVQVFYNEKILDKYGNENE